MKLLNWLASASLGAALLLTAAPSVANAQYDEEWYDVSDWFDDDSTDTVSEEYDRDTYNEDAYPTTDRYYSPSVDDPNYGSYDTYDDDYYGYHDNGYYSNDYYDYYDYDEDDYDYNDESYGYGYDYDSNDDFDTWFDGE